MLQFLLTFAGSTLGLCIVVLLAVINASILIVAGYLRRLVQIADARTRLGSGG